MKKIDGKKRRIIVLLVLVIVLIAILGVIIKKNIDKNSVEPDNYFLVNKYSYNLNGVNYDITLNYSYGDNSEDGKARSIYVTIGMNNKIFKSTKTMVEMYALTVNPLELNVYTKLGSAIHVLKGKDKDYLLVAFEEFSKDGFKYSPIILSSDKVIKKLDLGLKNDTNVLNQKDRNYGEYNKLFIERDALYFVMPGCSDSDKTSANEYKVSVDKDKINVTKIGKYSIESEKVLSCYAE